MNLMKHHLPCAVALLAFVLAFCAAQIPPGYILYPTGFYKLHPTVATWGDAWDICLVEGGHLAIINSDEEAFILSGVLAQGSVTNWCIIGFHDMFKEGQYVTVFGDTLAGTGYEKWAPGEPNNDDGNEDCGGMSPQGLLSDLSCGEPFAFVCEIDLLTK